MKVYNILIFSNSEWRWEVFENAGLNIFFAPSAIYSNDISGVIISTPTSEYLTKSSMISSFTDGMFSYNLAVDSDRANVSGYRKKYC